MLYYVSVEGRTFEVEVDGSRVLVDGEPLPADLASVADTPVHGLLLNGGSHRILASRRGVGRWELHVDGRMLEAEVLDHRGKAIREIQRRQAALSGPAPIRAPMPGMVVRVEVEPGEEVGPGQGVVIVEAMKMENELRAEGEGRVRTVHVAAGDAVEKDAVLVEFEPVEAGDEEPASIGEPGPGEATEPDD